MAVLNLNPLLVRPHSSAGNEMCGALATAHGESDEEDNEVVGDKVAPGTILPNKREVVTHNLAAQPYRSWCKFCVMGKAD